MCDNTLSQDMHAFQRVVLSKPKSFPIAGLKCYKPKCVGLGGLGATCSPRDPRFAGSKPAEVD